MGDSKTTIKKGRIALTGASNEAGLDVNTEKTKVDISLTECRAKSENKDNR
jgi:hypothetical protein